MVAPIAPAPGDLRAILINNNAEKANSPIIDLMLSAQGATEMLISNAADFSGATWEVYVTAKEWAVLDEQAGPGFGDGDKTVYVKFRDAEEEETDVHSATVELDTIPPSVGAIPIMINGGALKTSSRAVTLTFDVQDATQVELFNEDEFDNVEGTIVPFSQTVQWELSEDNGPKEVLATFLDDIGNATAFFSDTITLRDQEPIDPVILDPETNTTTTDSFITVRGTGNPESIIEIRLNGGQ